MRTKMLLYQAHFPQEGVEAERERKVEQYIQGHAES